MIITDRGRPAHVLLSFADYQHLVERGPSLIQLLGEPQGIADVSLDLPADRQVARPAAFE